MLTTETMTIVVSALALVASAVMALRTLVRHRRSVRGELGPIPIHRFTKRRLIMSGVLAAVGVMLFLGVCVIDFVRSPSAFTWFWLAVLGLLVWLLGMALFDAFAVLHTRLDLRHWSSRSKQPPRRDAKPRNRGD